MEKNILWTGADIAAAVNGQWIVGSGETVFASGVCYFAGQIKPGDLAFAVNPDTWGKKYQDFVVEFHEYAAAGAAAIIIDKSQLDSARSSNLPLLLVEDTRKALDELGRVARNRILGKVICITGSAGKTTTKEGLKQVLSQQGLVYASPKNFNHGPGVPLSLAQTPVNVDFGVYEFAVDLPNVTLPKAKIIRPHIVIVINIHPEHLSYYSTVERLADQKSLLFDALEPGGTVVLNRDDPLFERLKNNATQKGIKKILTFGESEEADIRLLNCGLHQNSSDVTVKINGKKLAYTLGLPGRHMVSNSLAILAGVEAVGADIEKALLELAYLQALPNRLVYNKIKTSNGFFQLIDDTFNSNVASVRAALEYVSLIEIDSHGRRIAVLGELSELGDLSPEIHRALATSVIKAGIDKVFTVGEDMKFLREMLPPEKLGLHAKIGIDLIEPLKHEIQTGDVILITAIRRTSYFYDESHLSHIVTALKSMPIDDINKEKESNTKNRFGENYQEVIKCGENKNLLDKKGYNYPLEKMKKFYKKNNEKFELLLAGDTSFGENYFEDSLEPDAKNFLKKFGYDYSLEKLKPMMLSADFVLVNLETPITDLKESPLEGKIKYIHWTDPKMAPNTLIKHNVSLVSLANNHTFDYGIQGFEQTLSELEKHKIPLIGAGKNIHEAAEPYLIDIEHDNGKFRLAIFAVLEEWPLFRKTYKPYAENEKPGIMPLDAEVILKRIESLKLEDPKTFVILFPHWGDNYKWCDNEQSKLAKRLIQSGVDLIVGHGAHMIQQIEKKDDKWIIHSIGNFMFNSPGRYEMMKAPPYSFVTKLCILFQNDKIEIHLKLYPIVSDNMITHYQPKFLDETAFNHFFELFKSKIIVNENENYFLEKKQDNYGFYIQFSVGTLCKTQ